MSAGASPRSLHEPLLNELGRALAHVSDLFCVGISGRTEIREPWPGSNVAALASARARAVADQLGLEQSSVRPASSEGYAECRGVGLSLAWRGGLTEFDLLGSIQISSSQLFTLLRATPELGDLPDEPGSALRELMRHNLRPLVALLAPDRIRRLDKAWCDRNQTLSKLARKRGLDTPARRRRCDALFERVSVFGPRCKRMAILQGWFGATAIPWSALRDLDPPTLACFELLDAQGERNPTRRLAAWADALAKVDVDDELAPALVVAIADARLDLADGRLSNPAWLAFRAKVERPELRDLLD